MKLRLPQPTHIKLTDYTIIDTLSIIPEGKHDVVSTYKGTHQYNILNNDVLSARGAAIKKISGLREERKDYFSKRWSHVPAYAGLKLILNFDVTETVNTHRTTRSDKVHILDGKRQHSEEILHALHRECFIVQAAGYQDIPTIEVEGDAGFPERRVLEQDMTFLYYFTLYF